MHTEKYIDKIDSHCLRDYRSLSKVIQFEQCIDFLERCGKVTYGASFRIHPADYKIIFQLLVYFYWDLENADRLGINLKKGIILNGPVGCGKTSLLFLMRYFLPADEKYTMVSCYNIRPEFLKDGFQVIEKYTTRSFIFNQDILRPKTYCFDDLGVEGELNNFGNETNVMAEILTGRYPLFIHQKMRTHASTNLSTEQLGRIYGNRIRSRMREMFNLIAYDANAPDKRK